MPRIAHENAAAPQDKGSASVIMVWKRDAWSKPREYVKNAGFSLKFPNSLARKSLNGYNKGENDGEIRAFCGLEVSNVVPNRG